MGITHEYCNTIEGLSVTLTVCQNMPNSDETGYGYNRVEAHSQRHCLIGTNTDRRKIPSFQLFSEYG